MLSLASIEDADDDDNTCLIEEVPREDSEQWWVGAKASTFDVDVTMKQDNSTASLARRPLSYALYADIMFRVLLMSECMRKAL